MSTATLPAWCCASGCSSCPEFREHERKQQPAEPPTAWCERCEATTYTGDGECLACVEVRP